MLSNSFASALNMKIAILSDIHDHIWNLEKAKKLIAKNGCEAVVFCGDMCAPFTTKILPKQICLHMLFGEMLMKITAMVKKGGENYQFFHCDRNLTKWNLEAARLPFAIIPIGWQITGRD